MNLKINTYSVICDGKVITNILKKNLMHKKSTEQTIYRPIYNTFKQCCVIQDH